MKKEKVGKKLVFAGIVVVFIIAAIVGISIYNAPANRLSRQLNLGQKYLVEQNYEQAIVEFDKAIAINPMNEEAYLGKAEAHLGLGNYEQAIETYKAVMDNIPESVEAYLGLAEIYQETGDLDVALEILQKGYEITQDKRLQAVIQEMEETLETSVVMGLTNQSIIDNSIIREELKEIYLREFIEAPTILGKPWREVTMQEYLNAYNLSEENPSIEINGTKAGGGVCVYLVDDPIGYGGEYTWGKSKEDGTFVSSIFLFYKESDYYSLWKNHIWYSASKDYIYTDCGIEGYTTYFMENNVNSIEAFLKLWTVSEKSPKFLKEYLKRKEENAELYGDTYSEIFISEYGETKLSVVTYGVGVELEVMLGEEGLILIDETNEDIVVNFWVK